MNGLFHLVDHSSALLLCVLVTSFLLLESSGIPLLNSTILLLAGALSSLGHANIFMLMLCATLGSITGACIAYFVGLRGGEGVLFALATILHIDTRKVQNAQQWVANAGARVIFLSRILPYIRPFACFPAGIAHMPFRRFFLAALSGSLLWCVSMLAVGWALGRKWKEALYIIQVYTLPVILLIVLAVGVFLFVKYSLLRHRNWKQQKQAEITSSDERELTPGEDLIEV